jgi:hypothetical protein
MGLVSACLRGIHPPEKIKMADVQGGNASYKMMNHGVVAVTRVDLLLT